MKTTLFLALIIMYSSAFCADGDPGPSREASDTEIPHTPQSSPVIPRFCVKEHDYDPTTNHIQITYSTAYMTKITYKSRCEDPDRTALDKKNQAQKHRDFAANTTKESAQAISFLCASLKEPDLEKAIEDFKEFKQRKPRYFMLDTEVFSTSNDDPWDPLVAGIIRFHNLGQQIHRSDDDLPCVKQSSPTPHSSSTDSTDPIPGKDAPL